MIEEDTQSSPGQSRSSLVATGVDPFAAVATEQADVPRAIAVAARPIGPASPGRVSLRGATRTYGTGATAIQALDRVDLDIAPGEYVVLTGPSGSGKTTLLNAIGGIDRLTAGSVVVDGVEVGRLDQRELTTFRRDHVSFVFQLYNLVPTLTALENVQLIAALTGGGSDRAAAALDAVGLADRCDRFPSELSGGEQQRVAVARALAKDTPLLLCDEPTGALDQASGRQILALIDELHRTHGRTVILVTHDESVAARGDRVVRMVDGRVVHDTARASEP